MGVAVTTAYWCGAIYVGSLSAFVTAEVAEYAFSTSLFDLWVGPAPQTRGLVAHGASNVAAGFTACPARRSSS